MICLETTAIPYLIRCPECEYEMPAHTLWKTQVCCTNNDCPLYLIEFKPLYPKVWLVPVKPKEVHTLEAENRTKTNS